MALLHLEIQPPTPTAEVSPRHDGTPRKGLLVYIPLTIAVLLILTPQPSFVMMLASHYLKTLHAPVAFWTHLLAADLLTFLAFTSLMACVVRDPGPVTPVKSRKSAWAATEGEEQTAALLQEEDQNENATDEVTSGGRWCRKCMHPRPERAHHCSTCGRCVLKMDHHCPWLGGNCVGYRTYPSFLHFIGSTTLLAAYMTGVSLSVMVRLISDPFSIDPRTSPLHTLFVVLMGAVFTLTMGSFLAYHLYLVSTNQTTLEHMSPFLLLRYLPGPAPASRPLVTSLNPQPGFAPALGHPHPPSHPQQFGQPKRQPPPPSSPRARPKISTALADPPTPPPETPLSSPLSPSLTMTMSPLHVHPPGTLYASNSPSSAYRDDFPYRAPEEHELTSAQRRLVQHTHGRVRLYDLGFCRNWKQVFGGGRRGWRGWIHLLLWGGAPKGDGRTFEKGSGVRDGLERLARQLNDVKKQDGRGR